MNRNRIRIVIRNLIRLSVSQSFGILVICTLVNGSKLVVGVISSSDHDNEDTREEKTGYQSQSPVQVSSIDYVIWRMGKTIGL